MYLLINSCYLVYSMHQIKIKKKSFEIIDIQVFNQLKTYSLSKCLVTIKNITRSIHSPGNNVVKRRLHLQAKYET